MPGNPVHGVQHAALRLLGREERVIGVVLVERRAPRRVPPHRIPFQRRQRHHADHADHGENRYGSGGLRLADAATSPGAGHTLGEWNGARLLGQGVQFGGEVGQVHREFLSLTSSPTSASKGSTRSFASAWLV